MPLIINTNIQSLNAQRNLNKTLMPLQSAMQRLSSGLRINSAKDDAAGLAVAVRMSSQIKGLNQAIRNANDAVSLVQTGEGAIDEITSALQRVRELAVQSANASNTSLDRGATDKEVQQLIQEVDRIATQTQFNNQTLLDGTLGSKAFQIGANAGQTINVALSQGLRSTQIGQIADKTSTNNISAAILSTDDVNINGTKVVASVAGSAGGQYATSAWSVANAVNASGIAGVTAYAVSGTRTSDTASVGVTFSAAAQSYNLTINGQTVFNVTSTASFATEGLSQQGLVDRINMYTSTTGVQAAINGTNIELTSTDGRDIDLGSTAVVGASAAFTVANNTTGKLRLVSSSDMQITGTNAAKLGWGGATTLTTDATTLNSVNVTTVDKATDAINRIDSALNVISNIRADLGAILNRFTSTMSNLSNVLENITAAHSRIMDADFASETANITKAQILQQAGISILAQANALPQNVLTLLRQ